MRKIRRWYRRNKTDFWDLIGALMIVGSVPMLYVYVSILQAVLAGK